MFPLVSESSRQAHEKKNDLQFALQRKASHFIQNGPATAVNNQLVFIAPDTDKAAKNSRSEALGILGTIIRTSLAILLVFSPLMRKNATRISNIIAKTISKFGFKSISSSEVEGFLANKEKLEKVLKRMLMASLLLANINAYQTAINSKQPSMFAKFLLGDIFSLIGIKYTARFIYSFTTGSQILYTLGKGNDIENNLHPEKRIDWDLKQLTQPLKNKISRLPAKTKNFLSALGSYFMFVINDFKREFSLGAWKQLRRNYRDKKIWATSLPNTIAAQIQGVSFVLNLIGLLSKNAFIAGFSGILLIMAALVNRTSIAQRALRNKTDIDGILVQVGLPLDIFGALFSPQFFPNLFFLNGLGIAGGAIAGQGYNINSKRYRALVEEIEWIHKLAIENPRLTASQIITHFNHSPIELKALRKRLGKSRVEYLFNLLFRAQQMDKQGVSLAKFLSTKEYAKDPDGTVL